ncbi:hypothetical protein [Campylobacter phage CAM-P21]|nr:hypothetical protein [Campylobacter phage CAM-P21]
MLPPFILFIVFCHSSSLLNSLLSSFKSLSASSLDKLERIALILSNGLISLWIIPKNSSCSFVLKSSKVQPNHEHLYLLNHSHLCLH